MANGSLIVDCRGDGAGAAVAIGIIGQRPAVERAAAAKAAETHVTKSLFIRYHGKAAGNIAASTEAAAGVLHEGVKLLATSLKPEGDRIGRSPGVHGSRVKEPK